MQFNIRLSAIISAAFLCLLVSTNSNANLVSNGTFDTGLDDWSMDGDIGTFWDSASATAHLGRPGTPGTSMFFQEFDASENLEITFDYQWQVNPPTIADFFSAYVTFEGVGGIETRFDLISAQSSDDATFGDTVSSSFFATLAGLTSTSATLVFELMENNPTTGTRVQLDNVGVNAVTVSSPASLLLMGLGIFALGATRSKKS